MTVKLGMGQEVKTEYKKRTLNPRFEESFDLLVYERSVEVRPPATVLVLDRAAFLFLSTFSYKCIIILLLVSY